MSNFVVMPKEDWVNALDSARAKAMMTDAIRSGDLSSVIDSIIALNIPQLKAIAGGTVVPASTLSSGNLEIEHNLGVTPNFVVFMSNGNIKSSYALHFYARIPIPNYNNPSVYVNPYSGGTIQGYCGSLSGSSGAIETYSTYTLNNTSNSETVINIPASSSRGKILSGKEYYWICGLIE